MFFSNKLNFPEALKNKDILYDDFESQLRNSL